jgi:aryl-alcohol dehydrogenase-like predicted oxidoreductase
MEELERVAEKHGVSPARAALAWLLAKPHVTSVITGARTREQLSDNLAAASLELDADDMELLDKVSALPQEYPGWMLSRMMQDRFKKAQFTPQPEREPARV